MSQTATLRPETDRYHPRLQAPIPVEVESTCGEREVHLLDISLGGARVRLPWSLCPGERVTVTLPDPQNERETGEEITCEAEARVVHRFGRPGRYTFGIQFWSTEDPTIFEKIIQRWFKAHGRRANGPDRCSIQ